MAFIRRKTINGKDKFYLVESKRIDGKVRQKVLAYLGESDTVESAIAEVEDQIVRRRGYLQRSLENAQICKERMLPAWLVDGEVPPRKRGGLQRASFLIGKYWTNKEFAEMHERKIAKCETRLNKLRGLGWMRKVR